MTNGSVTVSEARGGEVEELEARVERMHKVARECLDKLERLIRIAKGESYE